MRCSQNTTKNYPRESCVLTFSDSSIELDKREKLFDKSLKVVDQVDVKANLKKYDIDEFEVEELPTQAECVKLACEIDPALL